MERNNTTRTVEATDGFEQYDYTLRAEGIMSNVDPTHRQALTKTPVYQCKTNKTGPLKKYKVHLIRRISCLKSKFGPGFESILMKLDSPTNNARISALGSNLQVKDCTKGGRGWIRIQLKFADKKKDII